MLEYTENTQIKPLSMIFEKDKKVLVLLAELGGSGLKTFEIDVFKMEMSERQTVQKPNDLFGIRRTARYFALKTPN